MTSELLVAGAANLDRMMYVERIPEQGETIMALNYEEHPGGCLLYTSDAADE